MQGVNAEDRMSRAILILLAAGAIVLVVAVSLLVFGIKSALGQEHKHKPEHSDLHHKFYKTWMMPDNRNMSCCSDRDCEPSASKYENGSWYASRDGEWIKVPNHKVETERDSPDGQSHYCGLKIQGDWQSYCFLPASGS